MHKNLITKILIIVFTMGISFMGLNNVSASSCSEATNKPVNVCTVVGDDAFKCRGNPISPYESCRSAGCTPRSTSAEWYNNDCIGDSQCFTNDEVKAFDNFLSYYGASGISATPAGARKIQETVNKIHSTLSQCGPLCEDGRFGNNTISALANCIPCANDEENRSQWNDGEGKFECLDGSNPLSDGCCEVFECTTEIVATPDKFIVGEEVEIRVQFSSILDTINFDETKNIDIVGGSIKESTMSCENNRYQCQFTVIPDADATEIKVTSPEGKATYQGGEACTAATKTIKENIACPDPLSTPAGGECCMPKNKREDCANKTGFGLVSGTTGFDTLNGKDCGITNDGVTKLRAFCPCDTPVNGTSCDNYETGWINNNGCCEECGSDSVPSSDGKKCECITKEPECTAKQEKLNTKSCKCECDPTKQCCGIELNTVVPFIGDCIEMTTQNNTADSNDPNTSRVNQLNAFPFLMMGMSKILVTVILVFSFLIVIAAGLMMVTGVYEEGNYKKGMERIKKVVVALILLGSSGLILRLINPTFFGG